MPLTWLYVRRACAVAIRSAAFVGALYCWNARQDLGAIVAVPYVTPLAAEAAGNLESSVFKSSPGKGCVRIRYIREMWEGLAIGLMLSPFAVLLFKFQPARNISQWYPTITVGSVPIHHGQVVICLSQLHKLKHNIPSKSRRQPFGIACSATPYHSHKVRDLSPDQDQTPQLESIR